MRTVFLISVRIGRLRMPRDPYSEASYKVRGILLRISRYWKLTPRAETAWEFEAETKELAVSMMERTEIENLGVETLKALIGKMVLIVYFYMRRAPQPLSCLREFPSKKFFKILPL